MNSCKDAAKPRPPVIRRREVSQQPKSMERKLKADVEAWLRKRRPDR